jgi:hypothetical protein
MSLTSFVNHPVIRRVFLELCPLPKALKPVSRPLLKAPPISKNYSQVGVAFDYLLRIYLSKINSKYVKDFGWVAHNSLILLSDNAMQYAQAKEIIKEAEAQREDFFKSDIITEDLLSSILKLATLEPIFRAGRGHEYIGRAEPNDVYDLRQLLELINVEDWTAQYHCWLNPGFNAAILVSGADADILLDNMLIDIKTTKRLIFRREDINQLIGYYILHRIAGIGNESSSPEIQSLAIYYSRFDFLWQINVEDLISENTTRRIIRWWRKILSAKWELAGLPEPYFNLQDSY